MIYTDSAWGYASVTVTAPTVQPGVTVIGESVLQTVNGKKGWY